jgi:uncharacterized membrane protein YeaQ/YmgE (transglycosylase-associated protein family)
MFGILAWVVLGIIAGAIAKAIYPGHQGGGILATMILGILGAVVGGWLGGLFFGNGVGTAASVGALTIPGVIFAVIGAIVLLFIWGLVTRRTA